MSDVKLLRFLFLLREVQEFFTEIIAIRRDMLGNREEDSTSLETSSGEAELRGCSTTKEVCFYVSNRFPEMHQFLLN